jgi:hypothetical protein
MDIRECLSRGSGRRRLNFRAIAEGTPEIPSGKPTIFTAPADVIYEPRHLIRHENRYRK